MKTIFKQLLFVFCLTVGLFSCENDDNINFTAQPSSETIEFTSNLSARYLLSSETSSNIAERLVWNPVDFGVPTVVTYTLEGSIDNAAFEEMSSTTETNAAITVNSLLGFADDLGLDNDPSTTDDSGNPNNTGQVYFRVTASPGDGEAANSPATTSEVVVLNIEVIELEENITGPGLEPIAVSAFGLVGDVINNFGGDGPDIPMYTRGDGVHFVAINNPGEGSQFKIRENNDWSLPNYGPGTEPGTLSADSGFDNLMFPAGDILIISVDLNNLTISVEEGDSWGVVGDIINEFGGAGPDIRMTEDPEQPGLWFALNIALEAGQTKFRLNNDWTNNWGPDGSGGLVQGSFDNFQVEAGSYDIFLDLRTPGMEAGGFGEPGSFEDLSGVEGTGGGGSMELEPIVLSAFGLVGDVINEFGGNDTPDIPLYTRGDGVHFAAINNPGEGSQFKIRENNDWSLPNYGPGTEPGTLSADSGFDNLIFPAGDILIISVDLDNLTISVEEGDSWGVVGDVINEFGGAGPDIRLTEDPEQPGLWFALGIALEMGETKFRLNNDWTNNWGPDGSGGLVQGSFDNFQVESGTYNITLDLRTAGMESGGFEQQ